MLKSKFLLSLLAGSLISASPCILAAETPEKAAETIGKEESQQEEVFSQPVEKLVGKETETPVYSHIFGAQLMTEEERCAYLLKLDSMKSKEERDAYRAQHRKEMEERLKQLGG